MATFQIQYETNSKGHRGHDYYRINARNAEEARSMFTRQYSDRILNISNLTLENNSKQVANAVFSLIQDSRDPRAKELKLIYTSVAALTAPVISQFKHVMEHEELDDPFEIGKRFLHHLFSK